MIRICSNNHASFSPKIVSPPLQLGCSKTQSYYSSCDVFNWATIADEFMTKHLRIDVASYQHIIYILPVQSGCSFGGLGTIGPCSNTKGSPCRVWVSGVIAQKPTVYVHELGHNLGLSHAGYMNDQYGDLTDIMGYCCNLRCFAAPHSHRLKWSAPVYTYKLPIHQPKSHVLRPLQYIMITDYTRRENIFVQLRVPNTSKYEKDLATAVNIYSFSFDNYATSNLLTTITQKGQWWHNPNSAFRVALTDITKTYAKVFIQANNFLDDAIMSERIPV
jgi:hypothetical protein